MSSCEAELIALAGCAIELLYVLGVLEDLGYIMDAPVLVYTDSESAYDICQRMSVSKDLRKIVTGHNKADIFTKVFTSRIQNSPSVCLRAQ